MKRRPRSLVLAVMLAVSAILSAGDATAQTRYPEKSVRFVVGYPPGSQVDTVARLLGQKFAEAWGKPVLADNAAGAAGSIAADRAAKAAPDGYTLALLSQAQIVINPSLYKLAYDPVKDFAPVSQVAVSPNMLVVHNAVPARNVQELIELARARPGELTFASGGSGSSPHMAAELLKSVARLDIRHIPYKGVVAAIPDLLGGRVVMMFSPISIVLPLAREGKLRALAVTSLRRSSAAPALPTIAETGFPGFEVTAWYGLVAPARTPATIIAKLHLETVKALALPDLRAKLGALGLEAIGNSPSEFAAIIKSEMSKWAKVIKESGMKPDWAAEYDTKLQAALDTLKERKVAMGDVYPKVRVAAVQVAPVWLNREATVDKVCRLIEEAGRNGAQIVGFPEGLLPGYPDWFHWYMPRSPESIRFSKELIKNAIEVPSPATEALCAAARRAGTYVVIGMNECEPKAMGSLYNALLFVGPEGEILGVHRKIVPTVTERIIHSYGDGGSIRTYDTPYGAIGGLICGENTNSLARFALLAQHERIHIASWPAFASTYQRTAFDSMDIRVRYHAFEGRIFVISAAAVLTDDCIKALGLSAEQKATITFRGGHSGIIGPRGNYIAGPADDTEQILYADADMDWVIEGKLIHDLTGHYNRFDVFTLLMKRAPRQALRIEVAEQSDEQQEHTPEQGFMKVR